MYTNNTVRVRCELENIAQHSSSINFVCLRLNTISYAYPTCEEMCIINCRNHEKKIGARAVFAGAYR